MDLAIDKNMIDKDEYPQTAEIERRCVHMLADLWNAPESANTVGASAIGSSEACMLGGHGGQVALAGQARGRRQADRPPEHGVRPGAGGVAQVRQVLGHRDARGADVATATTRWTPEDMLERVDENTIMVVPTLRRDLHRRLRAGASRSPTPSTSCRPTPASTSTSTSTAASGGFLAPFCAPGPRVGLPAAAGEVDQHLGPQVRPGPARRRLGRLARRGRAARRPDLPRELPGRRHAGVPDQLLPARRARSSRSTTTSSGSGSEGYRRIHQASYETGQYLAEEIVEARPVRAALRQRPAHRHPDGDLADPARAWIPGYTLFDLADRLRIRGLAGARVHAHRRRRPTSPCSGSSCARASAATSPRSCSTTCATPSPTSTSTRSPFP